VEAVMSNNDQPMSVVVVLNLPRSTKALITYARCVNVALLGNPSFPTPTPPLDVFAANIGKLEQAETKAATRAQGAVAERDFAEHLVKEDLGQLRAYVQSVVVTKATPANAAAMVESACMHMRKTSTRKVPDISAQNGDVSGRVILAAKSHGPSVLYSWEYSQDQATWTPVPDTMKARTVVSGLTSASTYFFRFRTFTRAGQQGYSQVVSLLVH
jgi:hypothetical protein